MTALSTHQRDRLFRQDQTQVSSFVLQNEPPLGQITDGTNDPALLRHRPVQHPAHVLDDLRQRLRLVTGIDHRCFLSAEVVEPMATFGNVSWTVPLTTSPRGEAHTATPSERTSAICCAVGGVTIRMSTSTGPFSSH